MGSGWHQIEDKTWYIPKVNKFYIEKNIFVNRLETVIFGMQMYFTDLNIMERGRGGAHGIEF